MIYVRKSALLGRDCKETAVNDYLKTEAGKRDIPLSEELEAWLRKEKKVSHSKYVLAMRNHKPLTQSAYRSMWKLIDITRLFEAGLDIKEIQYLAGHSTVDMTLRIYTHYDRRSRESKTAEKVREALRTTA